MSVNVLVLLGFVRQPEEELQLLSCLNWTLPVFAEMATCALERAALFKIAK